jgi:signal transduction histidine kinase
VLEEDRHSDGSRCDLWRMRRPWSAGYALAVRVETAERAGLARQIPRLDLVLALGLVIVPLIPGTWSSRPGPNAASVISAVAAGALVVARRWRPVEAFLVASVVLVAEWAVWGAPEGLGVFLPLVAFGYAMGRYASRTRALVGLGALVVVVALHELLDPSIDSLDAFRSAVVFDVIVVLSWVTGALVRATQSGVVERRRRRESDDRARLAREFHDLIAHGMSVMVVQAEAAAQMIESGRPDRALRAIERVQAAGREGLEEMRRLVGVLRHEEGGPDLAPQPGIGKLDALVRQADGAGPAVTLVESGDRGGISDGLSLALYRIAQEAITNALRHANASRIDVHVSYADPLELRVVDDGDAPSEALTGGGYGISGMRERAELYGGQLIAQPAATGGFIVQATIPRSTRA